MNHYKLTRMEITKLISESRKLSPGEIKVGTISLKNKRIGGYTKQVAVFTPEQRDNTDNVIYYPLRPRTPEEDLELYYYETLGYNPQDEPTHRR